MTESIISSKFLAQLDDFGIHTESVQRNMSVEKLVELSVQKNEGLITHSGSLSVKTGKYTGRSPQDRYIIYDDEYLNVCSDNILDRHDCKYHPTQERPVLEDKKYNMYLY